MSKPQLISYSEFIFIIHQFLRRYMLVTFKVFQRKCLKFFLSSTWYSSIFYFFGVLFVCLVYRQSQQWAVWGVYCLMNVVNFKLSIGWFMDIGFCIYGFIVFSCATCIFLRIWFLCYFTMIYAVMKMISVWLKLFN